MPNVTIYHNPRCSKSRQAMDLLIERHITPTIIEYLKTPPTPKELRALLKKLALPARALLRTKESLYREKKLDTLTRTESDLIQIMSTHPILIERPIVIVDDKAVIGRPPENILELLSC